jgi:hypothetical protein
MVDFKFHDTGVLHVARSSAAGDGLGFPDRVILTQATVSTADQM